MSRVLRTAAVFALVAPMWLASGCKQGVGERCQTNDDCNDGLTCALPAGGSFQAGGTCRPTDISGSDLGVGDDTASASTDMAHD